MDAAASRRYGGRTKSRLQTILNQPLGDRWGLLYLSGYSQDYWNRSGRDTEYPFGYRNSFKWLSYSINASRQYNAYSNDWEKIYMASFSLPLGSGFRAPRSSTTIQYRGRDGSTMVQEVVNGSLGASDAPVHYGLSASRTTSDNGSANDIGGNVSWISSYAQLSASASRSGSRRQFSVSASGGP